MFSMSISLVRAAGAGEEWAAATVPSCHSTRWNRRTPYDPAVPGEAANTHGRARRTQRRHPAMSREPFPDVLEIWDVTWTKAGKVGGGPAITDP